MKIMLSLVAFYLILRGFLARRAQPSSESADSLNNAMVNSNMLIGTCSVWTKAFHDVRVALQRGTVKDLLTMVELLDRQFQYQAVADVADDAGFEIGSKKLIFLWHSVINQARKSCDLSNTKHKGRELTYGEISLDFLSAIIMEHLPAGGSYVDLGSGFAITCVQAALEKGAITYGCEIMEQRHIKAKSFRDAILTTLDALPPNEIFESRKRRISSMCLLHGDFTKLESVIQWTRNADLILCSNKCFLLETNLALRQLLEGNMKAKAKAIFLEDLHSGRRDQSSCLSLTSSSFSKRGAFTWTPNPVRYYIYKKEQC